MPRIFALLLPLFLTVALLGMTACSSDGDKQSDQDLSEAPDAQETSPGESVEDGYIVARLDTRGDGEPDIIRYFEEYRDTRDENRTRRRIKRMEIDVTGDQQINVRRFYDDHGNIHREENDLNLDGEMNSTLYFVGGELARKELTDPTGEFVQERRIYYEGQLVRVDTDLNGNGETDRWEYYEDGVLMRIGRDTIGDGAADTWQLR